MELYALVFALSIVAGIVVYAALRWCERRVIRNAVQRAHDDLERRRQRQLDGTDGQTT